MDETWDVPFAQMVGGLLSGLDSLSKMVKEQDFALNKLVVNSFQPGAQAGEHADADSVTNNKSNAMTVGPMTCGVVPHASPTSAPLVVSQPPSASPPKSPSDAPSSHDERSCLQTELAGRAPPVCLP